MNSTANTMPRMPHILPPVALPSRPASRTALPANTMATMPKTMPISGMKESTMARMPQTSATVALLLRAPIPGAGGGG